MLLSYKLLKTRFIVSLLVYGIYKNNNALYFFMCIPMTKCAVNNGKRCNTAQGLVNILTNNSTCATSNSSVSGDTFQGLKIVMVLLTTKEVVFLLLRVLF
jgi:hypothetical protein